jgi:ribosomal protein L2
MKRALLAAFSVLSLYSVAAFAQAGPPRPVQGVVTAATDTSVTITKADGQSETVALLPNRTVNVTAPVAVDQIAPGSYVATANMTQADGTGVSQELRVYPPGSPAFNVNRPMDASGQLIMTNGTVNKVVSSDGGRVLTVDFGTGTRQILVKPTLQVILVSPGKPDMVKPGVKLSVATFRFAPDAPPTQIITIAKADLK